MVAFVIVLNVGDDGVLEGLLLKNTIYNHQWETIRVDDSARYSIFSPYPNSRRVPWCVVALKPFFIIISRVGSSTTEGSLTRNMKKLYNNRNNSACKELRNKCRANYPINLSLCFHTVDLRCTVAVVDGTVEYTIFLPYIKKWTRSNILK